jgi:hypothetical protein
MRTVVAVTEPFDAAGPNALTQSPTARSVEAAVCVALTAVDPDVVIVSVCVFGVVGFLDFELVGRVAPGESVIPETVSFEPFTPVTLPEAMSSDANCLRKLPDPPGNDGRLPLSPPWNDGRLPLPPPGKLPLLPGKPPPKLPFLAPEVTRPAQVPVELGVVTVRLRAATVVFEFFEAEPVAVTQSPTATEDTDSVTVLENRVVPVHVTVVCPVDWFCTSILEALSAATLPVAPIRLLVAAPAAGATTTAATAASMTAIDPAPRHRAQRSPLVRWLVGVCMWVFPLSFFVLMRLV